MIIKLLKDHEEKHSPTCGEIREILTSADYSSLIIAIALDIKPTKAHYHNRFEEIYFVLDGYIHLKLYDPTSDGTRIEKLSVNELCVINKGVHHEIIESSENNRLCVIAVPPFDPSDENFSDKI